MFALRTSRLGTWASTVFSLDLRSLALFRMALGLVVIADCAFRAMDIEIFYTDAGVRPAGPLFEAAFMKRPSLHLLSGSMAWQCTLLAISAMAGLLMAVGWRTRTMSIVAWVLVLSVQARNNFINTGADAVLVTCLLFGCFLPLGARLSLDARAWPDRMPRDHAVATAATAGLILQTVILYVFNVINKTGHSWWNGTAVLQALHIDQHTTPFGHLLRDHFAWLSAPLTFGTLFVEFMAVLLLLPFAVGRVRTALVIAMWGLHLGLASSLYLGLFSPACMVLWLAMVPAAAWERRPLAGLARRVVVGQAPPPRIPWVAAVLVVGVVVIQLGLNVAKVSGVAAPRPVINLARAAQIDQMWSMFSVNPSRNDGWFVIVGTRASGETMDLMRDGAPVSWKKPRYVAHLYKNARWRKYMMNASNKDEKVVRRKLAEYMCRSWNSTHSGNDALVSVEMTFMSELTARNYGKAKVKKQAMGKFKCPASPSPPPSSSEPSEPSEPSELSSP